MSFQIAEIKDKINSHDKDVLLRSLNIIDEHLSKEYERGNSALTKIGVILTSIGLASVVLLFFGGLIFTGSTYSSNHGIQLIYLITTIFFLIKSIYYAIRTISLSQQYRLTPDIIYEIQEKNFEDSIRYEVAWKIWEYYQLVPINTRKLFWFNRSQRSFSFSLISLLILTVSLLTVSLPFSLPQYIGYLLGIVLAFLLIIGNFLMDEIGLWRFN